VPNDAFFMNICRRTSEQPFIPVCVDETMTENLLGLISAMISPAHLVIFWFMLCNVAAVFYLPPVICRVGTFWTGNCQTLTPLCSLYKLVICLHLFLIARYSFDTFLLSLSIKKAFGMQMVKLLQPSSSCNLKVLANTGCPA